MGIVNTYINLEDYIKTMLNRIGIYQPCQLSIDNIYPQLNLSIYYIPYTSMAIAGDVFLDNRNNESIQWQDFGHELCHALWHAGDQAMIPFSMREYQEWKAENFAQHLCIPTFMLDRLNLPAYESDVTRMIMEVFGVTHSFAEKRLRQYMTNLQYG